MDFRKKRELSYERHVQKKGLTKELGVDLSTLLEWTVPTPKSGDRWGNWRYDAKLVVLTHVPQDYEIRLDECSTSAKMLDWIFQVESKTWATDTDIADLIHALDDILDPQANLCSFGANKTLDAKKYLTTKS